jgi:hypothetical protein
MKRRATSGGMLSHRFRHLLIPNLPIDYKVDAIVLTVADSETQLCGNIALVYPLY